MKECPVASAFYHEVRHATLIAEIEYRAWTHEKMLRHASYKGLREVQDNAAVYEIE